MRPELPDDKRHRFIEDFGLSPYDAGILVAEREMAEFYEAVVGEGEGRRDPKLAANWVTSEFFGALNRGGASLEEAPVDATGLGGLLDLLAEGGISGRIAKDVFDAMWQSGKTAAQVVEEKGLKQISDAGAIEALIDEAIANGAAQVEQYRAGNEKVLGWFVGQVMKASKGQANPGVVNKILRDKLKS